ncbi:unnamed protein product [Medioppia subpectinata]|uniref:Cytochrome P450 n=1 Tax=Medioppia subpectinata TaxID=1979941 RepID=A0A7R9KGG6_9ACAR|nr:unnamed protein product [Medioppia subpectinata]CAG2102957.1 unnamed protein product [Medioppia subpectinata]
MARNRTFEGNTPILSVADPELIKKILVKDFHVFNSKKTNTLLESRAHPILVNNLIATNGDQWKRLRSVMTPAFSSAKMRKMYSMIKTCLNELLEALDVYAIDNNEVDMKTMYGNLTMDVISSCAFGTQTNSHTDPNSVFVTNANKSLNPKPYRLLLSIMLPKLVMKLFNMKHAIEESANEFFFTIVRQIMNGRKNNRNKYNDFLDLLINLEKNDNNVITNEKYNNELHHMNGGINKISESSQRHLDFTPRLSSEDYPLGDTGIIIKKGQSVEVPIYAMAHLDEFFPNPDSFIPDRFLPENRHNIVPYTYLPFGGGPRNCVGMRFGLMEAKLALAHVVLRYRIFNGKTPALTVGEPELIKNVLVKDFHSFADRTRKKRIHPILKHHIIEAKGDDWKRLRSIITPTFTSGKMKKMYPMIRECLNQFMDALDVCAQQGRDINAKDMFGNFTMDVIATCAFATKTNTHKDPNNPFMKNTLKIFSPNKLYILSFLFLPKFMLKFFHLYSGLDESANEFFFDITRHIIKERRNGNKKYNDFIQLLLNAQQNTNNNNKQVLRDENDAKDAHYRNEGAEELAVENKLLSETADKYITDDEILANAWIFFQAGYETTASTLTFCSYELALNPHIQQRLYEEVMSSVDANGEIDYDVLSGLPFMDAVVSETLRLHSPVLRIGRECIKDYKLGDTGITVKKGQAVEVPIHALHMSDEYYEKPYEFIPERFLPENRDRLVPYTYLPFGVGPRNCIGMSEYNGNTPLLIISEPQLVKQIFVKDFHIFPERNHNRTQHPILKKHLASVNIDDWKRIRSVLSPTFSSAKMKNVYPMINNCLKDFVNELDVLAIDGNEINMVTMYGQLTMDVISRCAFATKTNVYKDPNDPFVLNARKVFVTNVKRLILMLLLPKFVLNVMNVKHHAVESANQFFFNIIRQIIKERKNSHKKYNDLMDLLISAQNNAINNSGKHIKTDDENDVNEAHHLNEGEEEREVKRKTLMSAEKYLTEDEMLAQSWVFFAAGYETAATTLTFATYELALNPNCQQKLYEEVMEAVDSNGDIDYYLLSKLSYLDAVVSETLRLNPPAIQLERQAYEDYELPGTGLTLKKGQLLEFPIFAIHHNEEYYENAQSFIPERFLPQNRHNIKPYTYLPFGAGPRNCIGMRFGLMEAKLATKWQNAFGKLYGVYNGNIPVLVVAEPELVKQICVKDFHVFPDRNRNRVVHPILGKHLVTVCGDDWKRIRSIVTPTFSSSKMKNMFPMIRNCLQNFINELEVLAIDGKEVNVKTLYGQYTMDVIATCAFATKTNTYKDPNDPFLLNAQKVFTINVKRMIAMLLLPKAVLKLLNMTHQADADANEFFLNITRHIMKGRKTGDKKYNDFIELLMSAQTNADNNNGKHVKHYDENDVNEAHHVNEGEEEKEVERKVLGSVNKYITENEILAQAWVFFVAGYETTATTLTWASYELALNPICQQKLHEEIMTSVDSKGEIDYDLLSKLSYLDAVLSETLRLNAPAVVLGRHAVEDYKLGNTGITLKKGQLVEIPVFAIHRNEEHYENAETFIPERFLPENRHKIKPYTYIPFGAGPHNCIGMRFGLMEAKLALAHVIKSYRFVRSPNAEVPLPLNISLAIHSPKRVMIGIEKR